MNAFPLDPAALQITVRRLAEASAEAADEVGLRHGCNRGDRANVERLCVGPVHRVACT